ncbi:hypothetical protein Vadar_016039 [Vaccinium darrowii]|uniref:Uncharacterized protein n=1 Tax=Vaccinium darrowii TaxID=229202 RepID=A0ACB7XHT5_9ERIC|nr:hypothetical protein Vadar_016039 [Vaccinium darrowii]
MATTISPPTLHLTNPLFSPLIPPHKPRRSPKPTRATPQDSEPTTTPEPEPDSFESRLSQVRIRYRSGMGKKAEARKSRKGKKPSSAGAGVFLPPVPLKEPVSGGVKVDFGFSPYSERVNGRIAILGLTALFLVELATGKSVISYHSAPIVFLQVYFVAAVTAVYVKFEKERISVWPQ